MVMVSFQSVYAKIIDLVFRRVILLFVLAVLLSFVLINHNTLKVKTLNYLLPSSADMKDFRNRPAQMSREKLKNFLIYYRTMCGFVTRDAEEPAPCGITGYAYYYFGKENQAIEYYKRAIKLNSHFFWFYYNLGVIYYNKNDYHQAAEYFAHALGIRPENSMYFLVLTKTYRDMFKLLGLMPGDYESSLDQGYALAKILYMNSQLLNEKPQLRTQIGRQRADLQLF